MTADLPMMPYVHIADFAIAAGGLVAQFFVPPGKAKRILVAAVLLFLALTCGLLWQQDHKQRKQVRKVADEIVQVIGNNKLTYDEIIENLRQPDYQIFNAALTLLIDEQRIGSEAMQITDKPSRPIRVRLHYVRSF